MQPAVRRAQTEAQERSRRRYRLLLELAALDKSDFDGVLQRTLQSDADALEVERVNCWRFEADPPAIRCVSGYVRSAGQFESGAVLHRHDYPRYFHALSEDPLILADEARTDRRTAEFTENYLVPLGITSMMDVPIWVGGALWGVVCHEHVGPVRRWQEEERNFAISIGHVISMALEARERLAAERTVKLNEFFVAVLSHDLRNPLSTVRGSADVVLGRASDPEATAAAQRILRSTEQMTRMVEQLLDFTRARLGTGLPIVPASNDLAAIARRLVSDLTVAWPGRAADVEVQGDPVGAWDADRLWQVLSNLLSNAYQHGDDDQRVWIQIDGTGPDEVLVRVGNGGELPQELAGVIFDPFRQLQLAGPRRSGLGLGLFIAREIVQAHRGMITVESGHGETVFTIVLPRRSTP